MKAKPKSQIAMKIGENVFYYRGKGKITQRKLAEMINRSPNYIALLERGEKGASVEVLVALAKAFDCKASDLLKGL
jgi:transcriptional regulator with XRE-family HTH domain